VDGMRGRKSIAQDFGQEDWYCIPNLPHLFAPNYTNVVVIPE